MMLAIIVGAAFWAGVVIAYRIGREGERLDALEQDTVARIDRLLAAFGKTRRS